jgi:hypothetical protein
MFQWRAQRQFYLYLSNGSPVSDTLINFKLSPVAGGNDITAEQMLPRLTHRSISLLDLRIETAIHLSPLQTEENYT